jgi:hypothetical protein
VNGETLLDAAYAATATGKITDAAAAAQAAIPGLVERVRSLCAGKPWGTDAAGAACDEAFSSIPGILDKVNANVNAVAVLGENLSVGVGSTAQTDIAARDSLLAAYITAGTPIPR